MNVKDIVLSNYRRTPTGITVTVIPSSSYFNVELQRALDASGTPATWATITTIGSEQLSDAGFTYTDFLPLTTQSYWYRARHTKDGYQPGSYFASASATPRQLFYSTTDNGTTATIDFAQPHRNKSGQVIPRTLGTTPTVADVLINVTDSGNLGTAMSDSRGYGVNGMFSKPNENFSAITDGGGYSKTTDNEKTGAGRGFNALDSSNIVVAASVDFVRSYANKHSANLPRTFNDPTPISTVLTNVSSSGMLSGSMQDSRNYTVNGMFSKPNENFSAISDGGGYSKTTDNEKTGAGRGYNALDSGNVLNSSNLDFARPYTNKHSANLPRTFNDPTLISVVVGNVSSSGHLSGSMQDSRNYVVNGMFSKPNENISQIADGSGYAKVNSTHVDGSNRIISLFRSSGNYNQSADDIGRALGANPLNLLTNGGGQDGGTFQSAPSILPGWTYGGGYGINSSNTTADAKIGDRSLFIDNTGTYAANDSYVYQDVSCSIGDTFKLSGWMNVKSALTGTGYGFVLNLDRFGGTASWTILDKQGDNPNSNEPDVGLAKASTPTNGYQYVSSTFIAGFTGIIRVMAELGYGNTITGTAWLDGLELVKLPSNVSTGGYRASQALDAGNVLVTSALNFQRAYNNKDGRFLPRNNSDGTDVATITSNIANSGHLSGSMQDSRTYVVNGMFSKPNENFSVIPDGGGYSKTLDSEKTGASRAFSALDSSNIVVTTAMDFSRAYTNKHSANLPRTFNDPTPISTVLTNVSSSGNLSGSMQDSRNYSVNGMFSTPNQNISSIADGGGFARVLSTYVDTGNGNRITDIYDSGSGVSKSGAVLYEGRRRVDTFYQSDTVISAGTTLYDGTQGRSFFRGYQSGQAKHGSIINYSVPFNTTPVVKFYGPVLSYQPESRWATSAANLDTNVTSSAPLAKGQYQELVAVNSSTSGFTCRARLHQKSATTPRSDDYGNINLTSVGQTTSVTSSLAPSTGDSYRTNYSASLSATGGGGGGVASMVVSINTLIAGVHTEITTVNYSQTMGSGGTGNGAWPNESSVFTQTGLTSTSVVYLKIKSTSTSGTATISSIKLHGNASVDTSRGLVYTTATGDQYASMTPDGDDLLTWEAWSVV